MDDLRGRIKEKCKQIRMGGQQGLILADDQIERIVGVVKMRKLDDDNLSDMDAIDDILCEMVYDDEEDYGDDIRWIWSGEEVGNNDVKGTVSLSV
jgi:hypothetical protein